MRVIAYYLPQYHAIPENDAWWGKDFTEWNRVRAAQPLFPGHHQPVVPGELGYYNLLDPVIRERQAQLAREAGIEGFCYWHYWFGEKKLLEQPLQQVQQSGKPNFPFCVAWANESWFAKTWMDYPNQPDKLLIEQTYPEGDDERHFEAILPMLCDKRYIRVDGKPLLVIYRPLQLPNGKAWVAKWQEMAKNAGFNGLFLIGHVAYSEQVDAVLNLGFDAVNSVPLGDAKRDIRSAIRHLPNLLQYVRGKAPLIYDYAEAMRAFEAPVMRREEVVPTILPNWDHSPRSGARAFILDHTSPELFKKHVETIKQITEGKKNQLVMLKSWNEWSEGNYLEPDERWGKQYIDILSQVSHIA